MKPYRFLVGDPLSRVGLILEALITPFAFFTLILRGFFFFRFPGTSSLLRREEILVKVEAEWEVDSMVSVMMDSDSFSILILVETCLNILVLDAIVCWYFEASLVKRFRTYFDPDPLLFELPLCANIFMNSSLRGEILAFFIFFSHLTSFVMIFPL